MTGVLDTSCLSSASSLGSLPQPSRGWVGQQGEVGEGYAPGCGANGRESWTQGECEGDHSFCGGGANLTPRVCWTQGDCEVVR